jgi:hypothetical protein
VNSCFRIPRTINAIKKALWMFGPLAVGNAMLGHVDGVCDDWACVGSKATVTARSSSPAAGSSTGRRLGD